MTLRALLAAWLLAVVAGCATSTSSLRAARHLNRAFADVVERVSPSVVVIRVTQKGELALAPRGLDGEGDSTMPEAWRKFHEQLENTPVERVLGQGSGVILRKNGYILTNRHVVEDAEKIEVRLKDGRVFPATVRGVDRHSDVAVLKIEASDLPAATLADSARTRVGEFAIAIGAPFSLDYSVTFGHVSAKGRANVVPPYARESLMDQDFIQTDANINPGNSGGPLLNINGEVIGINTIIHGLRTGIGFAIPSNLAREVADQIVVTGKFARPWIGVSLYGLKEDSRFAPLTRLAEDGVLVRNIFPNTPAAESGLRPGDIITTVDGRRVSNAQTFRNELRGKKLGEPVALHVIREEKHFLLHVRPAEYVEPEPVFAAVPSRPLRPADLGLKVQAFSAELAKQFSLEKTDGVVVTAVEEESPADRGGLRAGDIILSLNDQNTFTPAQFREALAAARLPDGIRLSTLVKGRRTEAVLRAP